jgi:hypothetical protein
MLSLRVWGAQRTRRAGALLTNAGRSRGGFGRGWTSQSAKQKTKRRMDRWQRMMTIMGALGEAPTGLPRDRRVGGFFPAGRSGYFGEASPTRVARPRRRTPVGRHERAAILWHNSRRCPPLSREWGDGSSHSSPERRRPFRPLRASIRSKLSGTPKRLYAVLARRLGPHCLGAPGDPPPGTNPVSFRKVPLASDSAGRSAEA